MFEESLEIKTKHNPKIGIQTLYKNSKNYSIFITSLFYSLRFTLFSRNLNCLIIYKFQPKFLYINFCLLS